MTSAYKKEVIVVVDFRRFVRHDKNFDPGFTPKGANKNRLKLDSGGDGVVVLD